MRAISVLFVASLLSFGCGSAAERPAEAEEKKHAGIDGGIDLPDNDPHLTFVKVETVAPSSGDSDLALTGKITFDENHTQRVASPVDGRATKVMVELGESVKAGQTLVELSSPNIGQLHGDVRKAEQDVSLSEKSLERAKRMWADQAIAQKEVTQAEVDNQKARADLATASGRLGSLNLASAGGMAAGIRAQIPGTVVERSVLVGQEVRSDQANPMLTITNLDDVWVAADVFEQDLALVTEGAKVSVTVAAYPGKEFPGTVSVVGHVVDPATHTVKARCIVPNGEHLLKPEMYARIAVHGAGAQALVVPARAVLAETQPPHLLIVDGTHYRLREVDVGAEVNGKVRVIRGLNAGDKVVTDGAIFLKQEIETQ